jgi:electron transport complex protein RnfB
MDAIYKRLAQVLDRIPNGFPETKSGVELKLLAKLFTVEEAELACHLTLAARAPRSIAGSVGWEERRVFTALKEMTKKGLIEAEKGEKSLSFKLIPFVVGFYERQNGQIDAEFAQLFEEYYHEGFHKLMEYKPAVHRVIPIEKSIPVNIEVMPYERASVYIDQAQSWGVLPCICRVQRRLIGKACAHSEENCLVFSQKPDAFKRTKTIRALTKKEALEILADAGKEGLVHSTANVQKGVTYICNCCTCACTIMRGIAEYGHLNALCRSDFCISIDNALCSGCSVCIGRCPFNALQIRENNGLCNVDLVHCFGCGLCVPVCPTGALSLVHRSPDQCEPPALTESEWREKRAVEMPVKEAIK